MVVNPSFVIEGAAGRAATPSVDGKYYYLTFRNMTTLAGLMTAVCAKDGCLADVTDAWVCL